MTDFVSHYLLYLCVMVCVCVSGCCKRTRFCFSCIKTSLQLTWSLLKSSGPIVSP